MGSKRIDFDVAFDPITGSHQSAPKTVYEDGIPLKPNLVPKFRFESSLCFKGYSKHNKKVYFLLEDEDKREFTMFVRQFSAAIPYMVGGRLTGTFGFVKQGTATGLYFETTPPIKKR